MSQLWLLPSRSWVGSLLNLSYFYFWNHPVERSLSFGNVEVLTVSYCMFKCDSVWCALPTQNKIHTTASMCLQSVECGMALGHSSSTVCGLERRLTITWVQHIHSSRRTSTVTEMRGNSGWVVSTVTSQTKTNSQIRSDWGHFCVELHVLPVSVGLPQVWVWEYINNNKAYFI